MKADHTLVILYLCDEEVHSRAHEANGLRLLERVCLDEEVEGVEVGSAHGQVKVAARLGVGVDASLVRIREDVVGDLQLAKVVRVGKAVDKYLLKPEAGTPITT